MGWLGMSAAEDQELFWIAREGLRAPLPEGWRPCRTPEGDIFYYNMITGDSVWEHPCDEFYRAAYTRERARLQEEAERQRASQRRIRASRRPHSAQLAQRHTRSRRGNATASRPISAGALINNRALPPLRAEREVRRGPHRLPGCPPEAETLPEPRAETRSEVSGNGTATASVQRIVLDCSPALEEPSTAEDLPSQSIAGAIETRLPQQPMQPNPENRNDSSQTKSAGGMSGVAHQGS